MRWLKSAKNKVSQRKRAHTHYVSECDVDGVADLKSRDLFKIFEFFFLHLLEEKKSALERTRSLTQRGELLSSLEFREDYLVRIFFCASLVPWVIFDIFKT